MTRKIAEELRRAAWQAYRVAGGLREVRNKTAVLKHVVGLCSAPVCTYELRHGLRLIINNTQMDRTAVFSIREIFGEQVYDVPKCEGSRIIVDLGANIGVYALYASWKYPEARIYAVEPDIDNAAQLRRNLLSNGLSARISIISAAVSATEGEVTLFRNPESSRGHSLARVWDGKYGVKVASMSLERLFDTYQIETCDLLKMDIEGAEYEVLFGCQPRFLLRIRTLAIEYHQFSPSGPVSVMDQVHYRPERLASFLRENGFTTARGKHDILHATREQP